LSDGVLQVVSPSGVRLLHPETGQALGQVPSTSLVVLTADRARAAWVANDELVTAEVRSGKILSRAPAPKGALLARWLSPDIVAVLAGPHDDKAATLLRAADGSVLAELRATGPRGSGHAITAGGKVGFFGDAARLQASCVVGRFAFPVSLCEPRFVLPGALEAALGPGR
jgi:hypothetical protein